MPMGSVANGEKLHIFTQHGRTFTFHNYKKLLVNEATISFDYEAMSDDMWKHATFYVANVAGWSVLE